MGYFWTNKPDSPGRRRQWQHHYIILFAKAAKEPVHRECDIWSFRLLRSKGVEGHKLLLMMHTRWCSISSFHCSRKNQLMATRSSRRRGAPPEQMIKKERCSSEAVLLATWGNISCLVDSANGTHSIVSSVAWSAPLAQINNDQKSKLESPLSSTAEKLIFFSVGQQ